MASRVLKGLAAGGVVVAEVAEAGQVAAHQQQAAEEVVTLLN